MPEDVTPEADPQDDSAKQLDAAMGRFEGNYIESADLMRAQAVLTIESVVPPNTESDAKKKLINRPVISFRGTSKRFILGKTNERILRAVHGRKASQWAGKQIRLGVRYLAEAFGERDVPTIRIIPPPDVPLPMGVRKHYGTEQPRSK